VRSRTRCDSQQDSRADNPTGIHIFTSNAASSVQKQQQATAKSPIIGAASRPTSTSGPLRRAGVKSKKASIIGQGLLARPMICVREESGGVGRVTSRHHPHPPPSPSCGCYPAPRRTIDQAGDYAAEHRHGDRPIPHYHTARHGRLPAARRLLAIEKQAARPSQSRSSPAPAA
jgi:hypothetical protein